MVDFSLGAEQRRLQEISQKLADQFAGRADQYDREGSTPDENYAALREAGFYGLRVPKELGGWGATMLDYAIAAEALATGCASTALSFNMHCVVAGAFTSDPALPEARRRQVADLIVKEGKLFAANASEPGTTGLLYKTRAQSTQCTPSSGGWRVRGKRAFVSMVEACDFIVMFVHPSDAENPLTVMPLFVPRESEGLRIEEVWDTLGMRATRSQNVILEDVFVPDRFAFPELRVEDVTQWLPLAEGPIDLPYTAVYLGVGAAILRASIANVRGRTPKGYTQPLAYHPDVRRRIARMSAELEGARWLVRRAAWMLDQGDEEEGLTATFRAKYAVGEAVASAGRSALEMGGAHSLFKGSEIERLFRDAATAPIMQPPTDVCLSELSVHELDLDRGELAPLLRSDEAG